MTKSKKATNPIVFVIRQSVAIWSKLLFKPTVQNYREISQDPLTKDSKRANRWAYGWLIFAFLGELIHILVLTYFLAPTRLSQTIVILIIGFALIIGLFTIYAGATQFFAIRWMGGKGTYTRTLFTYFGFISGLLVFYFLIVSIWDLVRAFPAINSLLISVQLADYQGFVITIRWIIIAFGIFLNIQAVRAVHRISFLKAIITIILSVFIIVILGFVLLPLIFSGIDSFL